MPLLPFLPIPANVFGLCLYCVFVIHRPTQERCVWGETRACGQGFAVPPPNKKRIASCIRPKGSAACSHCAAGEQRGVRACYSPLYTVCSADTLSSVSDCCSPCSTERCTQPTPGTPDKDLMVDLPGATKSK